MKPQIVERYPGANPTVERLQGDGTWKRIGCLREGDYLSLDASLAFEEAAVFRFSPFRPAVEFHSTRLVHNVIMGESYHTDIDDIIRAAQRAGARGEMLALVSHGISPDAKKINMKTEWLERLLSAAGESGLVIRGVR